MQLSMIQIVLMAVTIALALGGGIYAARSVHSAEGYSLGGRSAGVPMVAGTIAGTCIGGGATVGTAQLAGTVGLSAWWFTIGTGLALVIMGLFYAKPLRGTALETISMALRGGGIFLPLTVAVFRPHAVSARVALMSMILSTATAVVAAAMHTSVSPLFIGLAVSVLTLVPGFFGHHDDGDEQPVFVEE